MGVHGGSARGRAASVVLTIVALTTGLSGSALGALPSTTGATAPQGPHADPKDVDPKDPPFGEYGNAVGNKHRITEQLSSMGLLAQKQQAKDAKKNGRKFESLNKDVCGDLQDCEVSGSDPDYDGPAGGQAETSIAVDSSGLHVVVGFNDTRGFSLNPISVSGFMYSDDGGATLIDGGQLPTPGNQLIGTTKYPQVFGDPEVKYLGGSNFAYFSIMVRTITGPSLVAGTVQTMSVHVSTDYGHTWTGPFEVTSATNPHGLFSGNNARDAADKEFADYEPATGRLLMSWSNFTSTTFAPSGVEISTTFSDNILASPPTWSPRTIIAATLNDGQASIPRFAGGGNAYVAWRRSFPGFTNNIGFARSTNNGATWSSPTNTAPAAFFTMDQVLGNDRVNTSPGLAVDRSGGQRNGNIYLVYSDNDKKDGADIAFQRSTDGGVTFSAIALLNSRPGSDRAQWFPWVSVDNSSGRVYVFYYDQGIATSGDLSETTYLFSDDGGTTWSTPRPLTDRPFRAGWGNDTGQPNLGDYNQAIAQAGSLSATWAGTTPVLYTDGEPTSTSFTVPDVFYKRVPAISPRAPLRLGTITFTDSGGGGNGNIDRSERVAFTIPLENYVTNPLSQTTVSGVSATLTTTTVGVTVLQSSSAYADVAPGATVNNATPYVLQTDTTFVLGTSIELVLNATSAQGPATLRNTQLTGTPLLTTFFSENFNGVAPGSLPAGWTTSHAGGANTVPWTTNNSFCGTTTNAAFHADANDGPVGGSPARFERLFSPSIVVPAGAEYVRLEFDVCYDTEDDPNFKIVAYDGFTVRITDQTTGRIPRSVLPEAFATRLSTGSIQHYPKHLPRSSNTAYFEDMSVWAGDSGGVQHVSMRLPGMAGSTVQLRFEYTQDTTNDCAFVRPGHACGVQVDNIAMRSVVSVQPADTTPPVLTVPADQTFEAMSSAGATVTFAPCTAIDDYVVVTVTHSSPNPGSFALGSNLVTCRATDAAGNFSTGSFKVTVRDTTAPVVATPPDQIAEATSPSGASVTYPACTATDAVGPLTISYTRTSGATFALGDTIVICTATDGAGNFTNGTFDVVVRDTTPPSVTAPPTQTAEATSAAGALVAYAGCTASDAVGPITLSYSQASGTIFPLGDTTVTCTATDAAGNSTSATLHIVVRDTTPPSVTAPPTQTFEATSAAGALVSYLGCIGTDTAGPVTISYSQASGTMFPLGSTTVSCTATDGVGNTASASFQIVVRDTTPPSITAPPDQTAEATSAAGAIVSYPSCAATDAVSAITISYSQASGTTFLLGSTLVTCTATDAAGNRSTASFRVVVRDTTAPAVTAPPTQTAEATSAAGALVAYSGCTATDAVSAVTISYSQASGTIFPLGSTTVTCTATDASANASSATFQISVVDTTRPAIIAPPPQTIEATSAAGAIVSYIGCAATDTVGPVTISYGQASGTLFPLGTTIVTCTATDEVGNSTSASFEVIVRDTIAPALTAPSDQGFEATAAAGALVVYLGCTATDTVGPVTISYGQASGTIFPLGDTTVTCIATDAAGNSSSATFHIVVRDTTAPAVSAPSTQSVEATSAAGAIVAYPGCTATDAVGPVSLSYSRASGTTFPLGDTTVTCTAADEVGNTSTASFHVVVRDTTAPAVTAPPTQTAEATSPAGALVAYSGCTATDAVSAVAITYSRASGTMFPLGSTTVSCTATDASGNSSSASFVIVVRDTTPPSVTAPPAQTFEATSAAGAVISYLGCTAVDTVSAVTISYSQASASTFAIGTAAVICTATDASGNSSSATFAVIVRDTTAPALTAPSDQAFEARSAAGAFVSYAGCAATDTVSAATISYSQASGTTFPLGPTLVTCTATDAAGNRSTATFTITVRDTTAPAVGAPPTQRVEATSAAGAFVSYPGCTATDAVGPVTISYGQASGTLFPLGTTIVMCTATDEVGNSTSASFEVIVRDTTPPTVSGPATQTAEATSAAGAIVSYPACTASDTVGSVSVTYSQASGTTFPIGDTAVTCAATDAAGNTSSATFHVIVRDTTAPVVTFTGNATPYTVDQTVNIVCSFSDAVGVVSNTCRNFSGPAYSFGVGLTTYTATATDAAANTGSATVQFEVRSTSASLCALTTLFSRKEGIAESLCAKLEAAAAALARGNTQAHDNILNAYENEVSAQSGKTISTADAAILIAAAGTL